jgi:uncharacterized protein YeaO (DUF488 family)
MSGSLSLRSPRDIGARLLGHPERAQPSAAPRGERPYQLYTNYRVWLPVAEGDRQPHSINYSDLVVGTHMVKMKRIYEPAAADDGYRVLVERLWPRGVSKAAAHLDAWEKDIAPSDMLRRWYGHEPSRWEEFQARYERELQQPEAQAILEDLAERARHGALTLLYSSHAGDISNAAVLHRLLTQRLAAAGGR